MNDRKYRKSVGRYALFFSSPYLSYIIAEPTEPKKLHTQ